MAGGPGVLEKTKISQIVLRVTVACLRGLGEHRRAQIWLSGVSECERSEARRAQQDSQGDECGQAC
jgi:hypothetical protein